MLRNKSGNNTIHNSLEKNNKTPRNKFNQEGETPQ
jgi:hypothetical protein